jgi:hypothetical protein
VSKLWHTVTVFGVSAGLLLSGAVSATAASAAPLTGPVSSSSPSPTPSSSSQDPHVTISVSTALGRVSGHLLAVYEGGKYAPATIKGMVTGAAKGDVVKLYAQRFPFRHNPGSVGSVKLTKASQTVTFKVKPTIATRYQLKLISGSGGNATSSAAPQANSGRSTVYLTAGGRLNVKRGCGTGNNCRLQYRFYLYLPPSVIRHYVSRHWDVYVGISRAANHVPGKPRYLYLDKKAWVHKARKVSARQYERTLGFRFHIGKKAASWSVLACEKDQEAKDGVGLPGRHGCGDHKVRRTVRYLG